MLDIHRFRLCSPTSASVDSQRAIALAHATRSFLGLVAPTLGGWLLSHYGIAGVEIAAAVCTGAAFLLLAAGDGGMEEEKKTK